MTPAAKAALLFALSVACSKSVEEEQQEAYARAYVALNARHPTTIPDVVNVVGSRPSDCTLGDRPACLCTWRFLAKDGPKEIVVGATFEDERASLADTVTVYDREGHPHELPGDQAAEGIVAGKFAALKDQRVQVMSPEGKAGTVPSEDAAKAFGRGYRMLSPRKFKGAKLQEKYEGWTGLQRIDACTAQAAQVLVVKFNGSEVAW